MADEKAKTAKPPKGQPQGGQGKGGQQGGGRGKDKTGGAVDHEPKAREGAPRLQTWYEQTVRARLTKEFGLANPNQVPRLEKIVLNVGMGDASKNPKQLEAAVEELSAITGQKAIVTLRGARMYEFLDRFITLAIPRIRDFRGLPTRSFDGRGNYTFGIREQMIFPEIDYDKVEKIHGMDITIVTSADRDDLAMALLRELGWPFRGETPQKVA
jgi:large subunit ribosomal protein L5